jgi:hypothetical protein
MALAIDSQEATNLAHHSVTSPLTWTFNNVAGTTLFVAVALAANAGDVFSYGAVTYNTVAMTIIPGSFITWNTSSDLQWYYLNSPATGSHTVSVTGSFNSTFDILAAAISFTGAASPTPYGTPVTHVGSSFLTSDSVTVPGTTSGNYVISAIATGSGGEAATSPNTLSAKLDVSTNTQADNFMLAQRTTGGGSVAAAFTFTQDWDGIVGFEVLAAVGSTLVTNDMAISGERSLSARSGNERRRTIWTPG